MNRIELEWQHLKRDQLSGQMFKSEGELALAIEMALYSRYDSNGFGTFYFQFSYAQLLNNKIGEAAIAKFGCDCSGCRQAIAQLFHRQIKPLAPFD